MPEVRRLHLPDFCAPRAVLAVLLIVGLTALVLALSRMGGPPGFWTDLARTALFLVWVGLAGAGLLCAARVPIGRLDVIPGTALALLLITAPVAVVSEAAFRLGASEVMGLGGMSNLFPSDHWPFLLRNVATGLVVAGLALRYFYVTHQWRLNIEAQARSRVNALQARIRPHFLYNSMNTIAALTRSNPAQAEEAVQDLADLFRANLSEKRSQITLKEELEVARIYQRIEQLRLGDRLRVSWQVQALPMRALVPSLTVQPLLENAIGHGIETLPGGGEVVVHGDVADGLIVLTVRNPLPLDGTGSSRSGHGFALANIRERLTLMYGPRADVIATRQGDEYLVRLRFPHVEAAREGAA
ncbi:MAG TPA: sensor histidine kinase [Steroidobacteraceae bacterium]|nr:sensor histidine kinase [Steroidobacteraceae bacterium]